MANKTYRFTSPFVYTCASDPSAQGYRQGFYVDAPTLAEAVAAEASERGVESDASDPFFWFCVDAGDGHWFAPDADEIDRAVRGGPKAFAFGQRLQDAMDRVRRNTR